MDFDRLYGSIDWFSLNFFLWLVKTFNFFNVELIEELISGVNYSNYIRNCSMLLFSDWISDEESVINLIMFSS